MHLCSTQTEIIQRALLLFFIDWVIHSMAKENLYETKKTKKTTQTTTVRSTLPQGTLMKSPILDLTS